jgi:hypothetical protein
VAQAEGVHVLECQQHIMDDPAVLTRLEDKSHIGTKWSRFGLQCACLVVVLTAPSLSPAGQRLS